MIFKLCEFGKTPVDWEVTELAKHLTLLTDYHANGSYKILKENVELLDYEDYAVMIRATNFEQNAFNKKDFKYISEKAYRFLSKSKVKPGDVLMNKIGNAGSVYLMPNLNQPVSLAMNLFLLRFDEEKVLNQYVYLFLKNNEKYVKTRTAGTVTKTITKENVRNLKISIPSLKEQYGIVETLSSLENKIENNNKIIENLEAQAQAIFKHWFVDFEFPNEDGMPYKSSGGQMTDSELGLIPSDWIVDKLGKNKLGNLMKSGIEDFCDEKIYLATADVTDSKIINEDVKITFNERPSRANMQPSSNTLWFAKMKDSRKLILVDETDYELQNNYIFSTGFAGLQANKDSVYYLWTYLQSERFDILKNLLCTGTTMQSINNSNINRIKIVIPPNKILSSYNQIVKPMFRKIVFNRYENIALAQLRDTLLPKLMSGEIRIPLD